MRFDLDNLPSDVALLHRLVRDMAGVVERRDGEIESLRTIIRQLQRAQFGRRSERLNDDQLALGPEDLGADIGRLAERDPQTPPPANDTPHTGPRRKPLPAHLPRVERTLDAPSARCPCCGGGLHAIGESVSEQLDCRRKQDPSAFTPSAKVTETGTKPAAWRTFTWMALNRRLRQSPDSPARWNFAR